MSELRTFLKKGVVITDIRRKSVGVTVSELCPCLDITCFSNTLIIEWRGGGGGSVVKIKKREGLILTFDN